MASAEERKLVSVLFADLAGSTELAVTREPEQFRALLSAFFDEMSAQIRAFGGTVEKYAGDAVMAVFGVPQVHEDDAERAVRAAVAMRDSVGQLNSMFEQEYGARLNLRVGIATGEAVAVTEPAREFMVTGEVANLAARLQSGAAGIVVSDETYRLVGALVDCEPLPPLALKGFPAPVTAHLVTALRAGPAPRGITGLSSPVVGRDREIAALRRCGEELARGRGQIVSIIGEAGIGKSRLKNELRDHRPEPVRWLEGRCQAFTQTASYGPIIQILRAVFQLSGSEASQVARAKLRVSLRALAGGNYDRVHAAVAHLLGVEAEPGVTSSVATDPRALQSQLALALRSIVEALAARGPLALTVEDLHWADPATIESLSLLSELTDVLPLMILVTSRPDHDGGSWDFRFHAQRHYPHRLTELTLPPLPPEDSQRLVENLLHLAELPEAIRGRILDQSEGNPFFVEELIRTLIEQGALRRDGERWVATGEVSRIAIPPTLRGLIAARIDRLPAPAKAVLQRAAVIGRFVSYPCAAVASRRPRRSRSLDRPAVARRAAAGVESRPRTPVRLQARAHAGGRCVQHPAGRAASPAPAAGADLRAGADAGSRPGGAARPSLAVGGGLGQGADLLAGGGGAGENPLCAARGHRVLLARAGRPRPAAGDAEPGAHSHRHARGAGRSAGLAAQSRRAGGRTPASRARIDRGSAPRRRLPAREGRDAPGLAPSGRGRAAPGPRPGEENRR